LTPCAGCAAAREAAREAAARAGIAAAAALAAARRAETAAADAAQVVPDSVAATLTDGHDGLAVLPFRHDRMSGDRMAGARPGGGAGDGAWRALDTDIETLD
jgi:hypothetical protein